ncbi:PD-(D/E)XK motif protein [Pseudomonas kitaguniensis]|uniref:PD-(D/E)XK motif protein n=1 Tax=Pseudomonas kitaguniensis TaxID=2607908 RepID=UPI003BA077BC
MKMSTTNCLLIWQSIKLESSNSAFKRFDAVHPLDFYLGVDSEDRNLLLFVTIDEPPRQTDMRAVRLKKIYRDDGRWSLLLILEDSKLVELFALLCEDLIEHSRYIGKHSPLEFVLSRLNSWRHFLERAESSLLTLSEIRGLCGELVFLELLIDKIGLVEAVTAWVGPTGANQDFQFGFSAWEVKTIRPGTERVIIASERQLDSDDKTLQLCVVELSDSSSDSIGGFNLNSQVLKIRDRLKPSYEALCSFNDSLILAGYVHHQKYETLFFHLRRVTRYAVLDGFPRLRKASLPIGIVNARYELELGICELFITEQSLF